MNATTERPADFTVETEITKALREQQIGLPKETERLEARLSQLRAARDPLAQAVQLLRVRVRAGLATQIELERATSELESLDNEIRSVEIAFDDLATTQRVITMELAEQLARQRVKVGTEVTAEAKRQIAAINEWLAAGQPLIDALLALAPAVAQFERGVSVHGHVVFHRELPEGVIRSVNFWTKYYNGGCDLAALRERWQTIAK